MLQRSEDGGVTWTTILADRLLNGVAFVDRQIGWAVGPGTILHTTDGGTSFDEQAQNIVGGGPLLRLHDVVFTSPQRGIAVGDELPAHAPEINGRPAIIRTEDAGTTWTRAAIASGSNPALVKATLLRACLTSAGIGLATGSGVSGSLVLLSGDAGATWSDIPERAPGDAVACIGDRDLWMVTGGPTIVHSADGGQTWSDDSQKLPSDLTGGELDGVAFVDPLTGWVAGGTPAGDPLILHTIDGGATWVEQALPTVRHPAGLSAIAFATPSQGAAVGRAFDAIDVPVLSIGFATQNAGQSWIAASIPPDPGGLALSVVP